MLVVVHSGQTGVERGAHRGAVAAGFTVTGYMPVDKRDELGPIPREIATWLTPCVDRGTRPAVRANITISSGVLLVVPDRRDPRRFTAMSAVLAAARAANVPWLACDGLSSVDDVVRWVHALAPADGARRLLVTGPRETRWQSGEQVARRLVASLAVAP